MTWIVSHRMRTNTVSETAFRGFGGPQGMMGVERAMDAIAWRLGLYPLDVRKANLYGKAPRNLTQYHMAVEDNIAPELIAALEKSSDYRKRRAAIGPGVQIRVDATNVLNHPEPNSPNLNINAANFGVINTKSNLTRELQGQLRISF